jgi:hypothetical protein
MPPPWVGCKMVGQALRGAVILCSFAVTRKKPGLRRPVPGRSPPSNMEAIMKLCDVVRETGFAIHPEKSG